MALKLDLKTLPAYAKAIIVALPSVIIAVLLVFLFVLPKQKQIKALDDQIDKQLKEIASSETKAEKLEFLKKENERLQKRLTELKEQLPPEREISTLLKQVSDLGIGAGLEIKSWKPGQKKDHPSGIVYEIPVNVAVTGRYHNLGHFFSSITKLPRIVNINDMKIAPGAGSKEVKTAKGAKGGSAPSYRLDITFTASTFSSIPEEEMKKIQAAKTAKKAGPKAAKPKKEE